MHSVSRASLMAVFFGIEVKHELIHWVVFTHDFWRLRNVTRNYYINTPFCSNYQSMELASPSLPSCLNGCQAWVSKSFSLFIYKWTKVFLASFSHTNLFQPIYPIESCYLWVISNYYIISVHTVSPAINQDDFCWFLEVVLVWSDW